MKIEERFIKLFLEGGMLYTLILGYFYEDVLFGFNILFYICVWAVFNENYANENKTNENSQK